MDDAPEAAFNSAWAYRQIDERAKAIESYELFIATYGSDACLAVLQNGDAQAEPPVAPNERKYEERVRHLGAAYEALTDVLVVVGNYQRAADVFETASKVEHFAEKSRHAAIQKAKELREMAAPAAPSQP